MLSKMKITQVQRSTYFTTICVNKEPSVYVCFSLHTHVFRYVNIFGSYKKLVIVAICDKRVLQRMHCNFMVL